ncbi:DUF4190 domain-containing protein [Kitasatospora sp. MAP5-34]|uniref:DUF4190 domain-containing protein n=1 Tax=Kitasatospora sp. MAP5-34 TaxID=3035102 RepID=UPI0024733A4B|nr:DUF4190 domain-containing protein [Kitasatospora sp. MAP5-34]MDH6577403.1 hypothetical protein [Kitasatospora sp. MAP5-34]
MSSVDDASEHEEAATPTVSPDKAPTPDAGTPEPVDAIPEPPKDPWAPPTSDATPGPAPAPAPGPMPYQQPYQESPYPGGPYPGGPYPGPYGWQPPFAPKQGYNGFAIASAVLGIGGFICCAWLAAVPFGIAALRQIRRTKEKGRGLAITGLVMSGVWLVLTVVFLSLGISAGAYRDAPARDVGFGALNPVAWYELAPGDCFNEFGTSTSKVSPTTCDGPHDGETIGTAVLSDTTYPGEAALRRESREGCDKMLNTYAMDTWSMPSSVIVNYYYPTETSWYTTQQSATCFLASAKHERLTGSLRSDRTTLTTDQFAYLAAVDADTTNSPDADPAEDPTANRLWAGQEADTVTKEIAALEGHNWNSQTAQPVAAFVAELKKILPHLRAAEQSTDTDTLSNELQQAEEDLTPQAKAVRAALGLATSRAGAPAAQSV